LASLVIVNKIFSSVVFLFSGFNSHSQMTIEFHPLSFKSFIALMSLFIVSSILSCHHCVLVLGNTKYLHPLCPCQKQPFTKITVLYLVSVKSGFPGSFLLCSLYLKPLLCRYFRTSNSGFVLLPFILLMLYLRVAISCTSAICYILITLNSYH